MRFFLKKSVLITLGVLLLVVLAGFLVTSYAKTHKTQFAAGSLNFLQKVSKLLPLAPDTKKELDVVNQLVSWVTTSDNQVRTFLILLQNSDELRPGGGFLGQYAVVKVKNGEVLSTFVEDANLLDQRIVAKITPPYPLARKLQLHNWKFRDSNFSPDFPTNAAKAQYFYRLAGGREKFDAVIAVNSHVFNNLLDITGPIQIPGDSNVYTSADGAYKLEDRVERAYLGEDVPAELKQNRKAIMKRLAAEIMSRAVTVGNISKLADFAQKELANGDIMLNFTDPTLQSLVTSVHWDGSVASDWDGDYLMLVDANLGALKSDYYVKRSLDYTIDFTGEKPTATVLYTYHHTATHGDWRTSDYHSYLRVYVPKGAKLLERKLVGSPLTDQAFNKTYFGVFVDVLIDGQTEGMLKYELPDTITPDNYHLLIQKQSGIGALPTTVHIKMKDGKTFDQTLDVQKDVNLSIQEVEESK